ncbi:phenylalanyl-tRNA synthetase, beta subunit [Ferroglobus placidus DSM 10642]|uniref:Phenylalanine--tRNA ligase beta subunit n=1 Tax=Ferroglobus placidus (strain DSM 10642 / AEDII12DO) TaxID=589924 RepID=D3S0M3_FERPA|nr:phenylalanine--tRNA ligase subunit beta [Ferroglobus placidus]ADC66264.1 phenylalanyl-tRNA synthetase, beta subunit [Ferroglobus placidus DSM 10642]
MPVVTLYWDELEELVGKRREEILEKLPMLGCDVERVEEDHVDVEFFPNRPDLYSVEGVARALKGFMDIEFGYIDYKVSKGNWKIYVDESVLKVRPRIVGCVVRNIRIDDRVLRSMIEVQEDLHWTIGRNRRKMAIGIHDLDKISFPLKYTAVSEDFSFVPLDFEEEMSVREILEKHPKGREYGFILEKAEAYPMIIDSKGNAISFPPIINAEMTRVTEKTTNLFIDVTGFDENVDKALRILAAMFADRGGKLESVEIIYPNKREETPDMSPMVLEVKKSEIYSLLGFKLSDEEIKLALGRMRYGFEIGGEVIKVFVPPYRADIMHEWDIIEDIAIGYGYDRIQPTYPPTPGIGREHEWFKLKDLVREIMIGLGFTEVITFTLTNERAQYEFMRRKAEPWKDFVPVMHPLTEEHTIIRTDILPKLLEVLANNKHHAMPQKVFEVGDVVVNLKNRLRLAACVTHAKANFSEIRSYVQALMRELDLEWDVKESDDEAFIKGRRADIIVRGKKIGVFGEIHPEVLEKFDLTNPVAAFEIDLSEIFDTGYVI